MSRDVLYCTMLAAAMVSGCSEPRGGPRLETYPVTGTVYVNGAPADQLLIECYPVGESEIQYELATRTDSDGNFAIGTYEAGDGVPRGEYALTFEWMQGSALGGDRKDRLKGRFTDPQSSETQFEVVPGVPTELGIINLEVP